VAPRLPDPPIRALDPARAGIAAVLWCTGFGPDLGWVRLPIFDAQGAPMHDRGAAAACPGVFFIGLPWLATRKSALIAGVADEAARIAGQVAARR
jgi:putative flavoprotein involved in K+ transport